MRVFVLGTGRCGTVTFAKACGHINNYSATHESRCHLWGRDRLDYADQHIEVDNRLSWFLGELETRFGGEAFYVHLVRDPEKVVRSFLKKWGGGIIEGFSNYVVMKHDWQPEQRLEACRFYVKTVNANIQQFLNDKPNQLVIDIDEPCETFRSFWDSINAVGNFDSAIAEFSTRHNASQRGWFVPQP